MGQELDLPPGTVFEWKAFRVRRPKWDHEHCEFCWAKFMVSTLSEQHRRLVEEDMGHLTEGYATTDESPRGAECNWVCSTCWDDFAEEYGWRLHSADS